jgi:hypothetical protein
LVEIPGLGTVSKDEDLEWYYSQPIAVPLLGGQECQIVVEGYDEDTNKTEFHAAIQNFLSLRPSVLNQAEPYIFQYYQDCFYNSEDFEDGEGAEIRNESEIWRQVRLGTRPVVTRRPYGDKAVYVSLECECDWDEEHGLQLVFKSGSKLNKVGPYDGHVTNSDAYGNDSLENVVYCGV